MIVNTEISKYTIAFRCVQAYATDKAQIYCYSPNGRTELLIIFQIETEEIGKARIDSLPIGMTRVVTYFPMSMFENIYHVLQTEKPIRLYANNNNNYTQVLFGTEIREPVGEEESQ